MYEIYVYSPDDASNDYSTVGIAGALFPTSCTYKDGANSDCEVQLEHPIDEEYGKYLLLERGNILSVPVPTRTTPEIQNGRCVTTVWTYKVMDASLLTNKKQRTLYKKAKGSSAIKVLDPGTVVTVVSKPISGEEKDIRWKVKTEKYGTGYMYPEGLDDEVQHVIEDNSGAIEAISTPWTVQPQLFRIYDVEQGMDSVTVSARHISYDLLYNLTRYSTEESVNLNTATTGVLSNCYSEHDFTAYTNVDNEQSGLDYKEKNPINAFLDPEEGICKKFGVGLIRNNFELYFLHDPGINRGVVVEYGKNMTDINFKSNHDEIATRIIPVGEKKDGTELYLSDNPSERYIDSPHINDYPVIHCYKLECENCKVGEKDAHGSKVTEAVARARMREQAQKLFDESHVDVPNVEMEVRFVNLGDTVEYEQYRNLENCFTFDYIIVRHKKHNIDVTAQITEIEWDVLTGHMNSVTIGQIGKTEFNKGIATWQIPNGFSGSKISPGTVGSSALVNDIISARHIQSETINTQHMVAGSVTADVLDATTVNAMTITAVKAEVQRLVSGQITTDELYVNLALIATAQLTTAKIKNANIDWAQITNLTAKIADIAKAEIRDAKISVAQISNLSANVATIANGMINNANIGFAHIKDNVSENLITKDAVADRYFIDKLQVRNLQVLDQTVGNLTVKASDGKYYRLDIDTVNATVTPVQVSVTDDEIAAGVTNTSKRSIIETDLTVADLSATNIKGINALIDKITASRIEVDSLFAREATIGALNAYLLKAETIESIKGQLNLWASEKINVGIRDINIGGANLLTGTDKTIGIGHIQNNVGVTGIYRHEPDTTIDYPDRWMRVQDDTAAHTWIRHYFNADDHVPLIVGETYTLSADVIRHKGQIRIGSSTRFSSWMGNDVLPEGQWKRISQTFVASEAGNWLMIDCQRADEMGSLYFDVRKVKLEYGNKDSGWRLSDGEYKAGSALDMTKDHVNISTPEFNVNIEGENAIHMDKDGGTFANMTVTDYFDAPNVARTVPAQDIHVKSGNRFAKLSQVAAYLNNRIITGNVTIYLDEDAYGDYELAGIGGSGILGINTLGHTLYGSLTLSNISCEIDMYGVQIALPSASAKDNALDAKTCMYIYMRDDPWSDGGPYKSKITGKGASVADSTAIYLHSGTNAYIINTTLFNAESLIAVRYGCNVGFYGMSGNNCTNFITGNRSVITWTGSRPVGKSNLAACLTSPADLSTLATNDGSGSSPTPSVDPITVTVDTTKTTARTYTTSWFAAQEYVFQGYWNNVYHRAVYWFDRTKFSGKTIKKATITLTRAAGSGVSGAVALKLWGTPLDTWSGNPTTDAVPYIMNATIDNGKTQEIEIPLAAAQALADGTIKGLMFDPGDTVNTRGTSENYTKLKSIATLTVTY